MTAPTDVLRIAHRAGNSPTLVAPALAAGADLVEADVHVRRGRLEVRHAKSMGPLPWLWEREPWELLRPGDLELAGLLAQLGEDVPVMLDLKGWQPWLGPRVRETIGTPSLPYTLCSRYWRTLDAFADSPDVRLVHSVRTSGELARLPRRLASRPTWGVSVYRELLSPSRVSFLRGLCEVVMTWPVDTSAAYDQVVAMGVNAVISNDLSALPPRQDVPPAADGRLS